MRCPDCNKFVGNEQAEPEINLDASLQGVGSDPGDANVTGDVRLVLQCADCNTELAESNQSLDIDVSLTHEADFTGEHEVSVSEESADNTDRYDGKPNTPSRYRRHYYGAEIKGKVTCTCGAEGEFSDTVEEQAGAFDQLN